MPVTKVSDLSAVTDLLSTDELLLTRAGTTKKIDGVDLISEIAGEWDTYTPALTASSSDPTLGSGSSQSGYYVPVNNMVHVSAGIIFGSSGAAAGSGTYRFSLPVAAHASQARFLGSAFIFKDGAANLGICDLDVANQWVSLWINAGSAPLTHAFFTTPASDQIHIDLTYRAA